MRMFDLLTSGVIFAGRRGWGVVAALGLGFGVILALGGSWARWVYLLFLLFPALEDARTGYVSDGWPLVLSACGGLLMLSRGAVLLCLLTGVGMGALYGLLYLISRRSLGLADVFLAAASSLWLLPMYGLLSLWLTSLAALLWCAFFASAGTAGAKDGDPLRALPGDRRCFGVWGAGNGGNGFPSRIVRAFFSLSSCSSFSSLRSPLSQRCRCSGTGRRRGSSILHRRRWLRRSARHR